MKDVKFEFGYKKVEVKNGCLDIWDDESCFSLNPNEFKKILEAINYKEK